MNPRSKMPLPLPNMKLFPRVEEKDPEMSSKMEEFIINTIVSEKDGNEGNCNMSKTADAIKKELETHFGGYWSVFISKFGESTYAHAITRMRGTKIKVCVGDHYFIVFRTC